MIAGLSALALFGPLAGQALAQEVTIQDVVTATDNVWVVMAAALVFLMQAGFALVEAGFTRAKNTANIVMKNFMDFSVGALVFWAFGFGFAYGGASLGGFIAYGSFFLGDTALSVSWFFQVVFAATAATIVSGAMAERTKFSSYLVYTTFISGIIYPVVVHWVWGGGWLTDFMGTYFHDFAGSGVVHLTGGVAAFVGAMTLGPRIGKYDENGKPQPIPGHSLMLGALGVFILWFGWYGFNGGSTLAAVGQDFASVCVTTTLAAAAGSLSAMIAAWSKKDGRPDPGMTLNGALAGLVGITAGCAFVSNLSSVIIGLVAGVLVVAGIGWVDRLKVDDPVGAVAVHGLNGIWGLLAVGLFDTTDGLFTGGGATLLVVQAVGALAIVVWAFATSTIVFRTLKATMGLRVSAEEELAGLDRVEHGASAYPEFMEQIADPRTLDPIS
jgi:Amt family ammonium transporter